MLRAHYCYPLLHLQYILKSEDSHAIFAEGKIRFKLKCHSLTQSLSPFVFFLSLSLFFFFYRRRHSQERQFLVASISAEFIVSVNFYILRAIYLNAWGPGTIFIILFLRSQFTNTLTMGLIFLPKLWYQHKSGVCIPIHFFSFFFFFASSPNLNGQTTVNRLNCFRNHLNTSFVRLFVLIGIEFDCCKQIYLTSFPFNAISIDFQGAHDASHHGGAYAGIYLGDPDIGELTISEMSPEDIRAELKRYFSCSHLIFVISLQCAYNLRRRQDPAQNLCRLSIFFVFALKFID